LAPLYPKISIVTPVYNQVDYIEGTILSVIGQCYPNLEYIIVDGGSNDGTLEIIRSYEGQISQLISGPDFGMYDAINKGFAQSTGEIMAWINGDDKLLANSLFNMYTLFKDLPNVNWIQGLNSVLNINGEVVYTKVPKKFSLFTFLNGDFQWIQQESTFWRRSLWQKAGGQVRKDLKFAGDFDLWFRYFQFEKLYYVNIPIGAWRMRPGQMSVVNKDVYLLEASQTIAGYPVKIGEMKILKKLKLIDWMLKILTLGKLFKLNYLNNLKNRYSNLQEIEIGYSHKHQKFQLNRLK